MRYLRKRHRMRAYRHRVRWVWPRSYCGKVGHTGILAVWSEHKADGVERIILATGRTQNEAWARAAKAPFPPGRRWKSWPRDDEPGLTP